MIRLVDVVNFNADGSCLDARSWLEALEGGDDSRICRWLGHFVTAGKPVTLGLVGGTVADIARYNPEAIARINRHPEIFEVILRPFAHDVALLRTAAGFRLNFELGRQILEREFDAVSPWYLPPEFMLNNSQVNALADWDVAGTFVNPDRFKPEVQARLPAQPYWVSGVLGGKLRCIPFRGPLADGYLDSLHRWSGDPWNRAVAEQAEGLDGRTIYSWRDGESFLLLPEGQRREARWLDEESPDIERVLLRAATEEADFGDPGEQAPSGYGSYPVHSFASWFREFRMLGFLERVQEVEQQLAGLSQAEQVLFLQAVGSDVLSAVEKDSPVIRLWTHPDLAGAGSEMDYTLYRSSRSYEGEDYLAILDGWESPDVRAYATEGAAPHLRKLQARLSYFEGAADAAPGEAS